MPQKRDRRGQVLHWDDVYTQFANAAETMPIEAVDRELAAKGYDRDKVRRAIGRLGRHTSARMADTRPAAERYGMRRWRAKHAVAGMVGTALAGLLALPVCEAVVARWSPTPIAKSEPRGAEPHVTLAEANPVGAANARDTNSDSPDKAKLHYGTKTEMLKKCAADDSKGACGKELPLPKHDGAGKDVATSPKSPELPRLTAQAPGDRPSSTGTG